ncbi:MAG TPA: hypothetical protein VGN46_18290 [Luteibacter sp.]|jgi:hypothetical protein|uniref:hypothetical protein n=1 Tax=Luteibacter sp. TaxID=1886636 RepID=UPI002F403491
MTESFKIAFEQVQLLSGLAPDQPVWLYMRATLHNADDLDTALDTQQIGALPPDANRSIDPSVPLGDAGIYAPGLAVGDIVRNDVADFSTSQLFPRFELSPMAVAEGQILAVEVFLVPKVWLKTIRVPQSEADKWLKRGFLTLLGASGFGVWGAIGGAIIGFLWGEGDQDVDVPCTQTLISARHLFTFDDLKALQSEGMRQFGPADNDLSAVCGAIDSFYWLSANQHVAWSFGPSRPVEQSDCQLRPWRHRPVEEWLSGTWLDRDTWETSCVGVSVNVTDDRHADVWVFDEPSKPGSQSREFDRCPITSDHPPNEFTRNRYDDGCPPRSVSPVCAECKRFSNIPSSLIISNKMLLALALAPRHLGAERWIDPMVQRIAERKLPSCAEAARLRRIMSDAPNEVRPFGRGVLFKQLANDDMVLWPKGSPPPKLHVRDQPRSPLTKPIRDLSEFATITDVLYGCFKVAIGEREALFTYAEVPEKGKPKCPRLRYVRWNDDEKIVKDVMLQLWIRPPR